MTNQSGQAVLIILLTMVVALTVVLSIIAATTSDIKISSNETNSLRAFSAAETGIEKALLTNTSYPSTPINGATFTANLAGLAQGTSSFNYPANIISGDSGTFWFVSHDPSGGNLTCVGQPCFTGNTIKICWGAPGTSSSSLTTPAVELSVFYLSTPGSVATAKVAKALFDPNSVRRALNSYAAPDAGCTIGTINYAFQKQFDLSSLGITAGSYGAANGLQFMSVKVLYNTDNPHPIGINVNFAGNSALPSQGNLVSSTGSLNQATRKVEVTRVYNQAPPVFDTAVFSPGGLTQ
jgi:hypothetical protein